jgi:hypothetical protein
MANNLLTYNSKVTQIEQAFYSPVSIISGQNKTINTTYCFLAHILPYGSNDTDIEVPEQTQKYIKKIFRNIFVAKKINSSDICPVIHRVNWSENNVYDVYSDDIDILAKDENGFNVYNFYIKNKFDQVFKCLSNNANLIDDIQVGQISTIEPYFQPGTYQTNNIFNGVDGYKWKYIYTIDTGNKIKFMDSTWMPIPIGNNRLNPTVSPSGYGGIEVINVLYGGSGYNPTTTINVVIEGDGTGATAIVLLDGDSIKDIIVTNSGSNYTYASAYLSVESTSPPSSTAVLELPISPIGGHGFDPISEFGTNNIMYTVEFNGDENGMIPTDIDYRQVGLIVNPISTLTSPDTADADIYKTSTDFLVAGGAGIYTSDELIYQGPMENPTFEGVMLSFSTSTDIINIIPIRGTPKLNTPIFGKVSGCVRTLLSVNYPYFIIESGYLTYIENRPTITRSFDGIEQFKFVLSY